MNNNKTDEAAILSKGKGVFSKASYITVGTKDQPEPYGEKKADRSNFGGKQFAAISSKSGKTPNTYFTPKHDWIADVFEIGDAFVDRTRYAEVQKERAKGFLTGDFRRRDEFSNTIRTEQWREQLKQEQKYAKAALETTGTPIDVPTTAAAPQDDFLYDRVFGKSTGRFCRGDEAQEETDGCVVQQKERHLGSMQTTYALAHRSPTTFEKPAFARKPIIRDTFYRKMNIPFAQN